MKREFNYCLSVPGLKIKVFFSRRLDRDELELFILGHAYKYYEKLGLRIKNPRFCIEGYPRKDTLYFEIPDAKKFIASKYEVFAVRNKDEEITPIPLPTEFLTHGCKEIRDRAKLMLQWAPELRRRRELFGGYFSPRNC